MSRFYKIGAIDIRNKTKRHRTLAVVPERFIGHHGTKIRTSDANVDNIFNTLASMSLPVTATNLVAKSTHSFQDSMNLRHHILAINHDFLAFRSTKSDMKDSTIFRNINLIAMKHRINAIAKTRLLSQLAKQRQGLFVDAIFGVIEKNSSGLGC